MSELITYRIVKKDGIVPEIKTHFDKGSKVKVTITVVSKVSEGET